MFILAVQSPDHHDFDLRRPAAFSSSSRPGRSRAAEAMSFPCLAEIPTTNPDVNCRRVDLKAERLLVVRGEAGVKGDTSTLISDRAAGSAEKITGRIINLVTEGLSRDRAAAQVRDRGGL